MATTMQNLPPEVVHQIFGSLGPKDASSFRVQGWRYAIIGAEYLETRIRFSTDEESLDRLRFYASRAQTRKRVTDIVYEGNLLSCRTKAEYFNHFKMDHHAGDLPQKPTDDASDRAVRLYRRNLAQWEAGQERDFVRYRDAYDKQQATLLNPGFTDTLDLLSKFPKIESIQLSTEARCGHRLSERFLEKYPLTCAMPMEMNSDQSIYQLSSLILPKSQPLLGLKKLDVGALSPRAFNTNAFKSGAVQVFSSLTELRICFRLDRGDRSGANAGNVADSYRCLKQGNLKACLAAANDLESLTLTFDDLGYFGPTVDIKHILGDTVWPCLSYLDIDCMKGGADLVQYFERQPALKHLCLSFMYLEYVAWRDIISDMKEKLTLHYFTVKGLLEDEANYYSSVDLDETSYLDDHVEIELADVLEDFVTAGPRDEGDDFNPLLDITWSNPDSLYARYGTIEEMEAADSSGSSDLSDDSDGVDSDSEDFMDVD